MNEEARRADRVGGAAGMAFVALFLASPFFGGSTFDGPDQTGEAIARDLAENRFDGLGLNIALIGLAAVAGFWFVAALHRRLHGQHASTAASAVLVGGMATVMGVLIGSGVVEAATTVDSLVGDPQVAKTLWLLEQGFFSALIAPPMIAFAIGVGVHAIRHRSLPRWVGWTGLLTAVGLTVNIALGLGGLAAAAGFIWVLAVAFVLAIGRAPVEV
jgi:hypothetical protein